MTKSNNKFLEEICDGCTEGCLLKYLILDVHHDSRRLLTQLKNIDKLKWEESERQNKDIGWEGALKMWTDKGYAKKFNEFYSEDKRYDTIYREVMR